MTTFDTIYEDRIVGKLTMADRMIFKGYLTGLFPQGAFQAFLSRQGVLLKDFRRYVERATAEIKAHAEKVAAASGRPLIYLESAHTRATGHAKEELVAEIAERDGVSNGLVCVLSTLETAMSFEVRGNRQTKKLEAVRKRRKCLHYYFYALDPEFGLMHVRLQSWFPFTIQVYINGHEWLARQLDAYGVAYERHDNALTRIEDLRVAEWLCDRFFHRKWPRVLDALARIVNPWLPRIGKVGFGGYYWVIDQCEISTDIIFKDRASLEAILPDLYEYATTILSTEDAMKFLGRKMHGNFKGEVTTDYKRRPEGCRVKFRMRRNNLKMYDKGNVLRVETTINNPREFRVLRLVKTKRGRCLRRWAPMGKGVANLWRYACVARQANERYLDALGHVHPKGEAVAEIDDLCRSQTRGGKRYAKFNPIAARDSALFAAVLMGNHLLNGLRNGDLAKLLPGASPRSAHERKQRCARVSRLLAKLRGHHLVSKVPGRRLYRVTPLGHRLMSAVLRVRQRDLPAAIAAAA
jgi:hypothetical protein